MEKLNKILKKSLAKKGLAETAEAAQICFYAQKWEKMSISPISFSGGILKLSASSSSEASEIQMLSCELIDFVNKKIGRDIVKRIRIINQS